MTVKELIKELQEHDADSPVAVGVIKKHPQAIGTIGCGMVKGVEESYFQDCLVIFAELEWGSNYD